MFLMISFLLSEKFFLLLEVILFCSLTICSSKILRCSQINKTKQIDFHIMQTCTLSSQNIIIRTYAKDVDICTKFTRRFRGLAFNFADPEITETSKGNCIIYDCPEFNVTSLKQYESYYHYYSAYAKVWPAENMTCIPKEGLYMFSEEKVNYTVAITKCEEFGGKLVNILTEEATNRVANLISKSKNSRVNVFVGLNDIEQEGKFLNLDGAPLTCLAFRSWAAGEPRSRYENEDCVTIDAGRYWRVQQCNKTFPYICEIIPSGPLNLSYAYCNNIEDGGNKKECYEYFDDAEIQIENETCARNDEELNIIKERGDKKVINL